MRMHPSLTGNRIVRAVKADNGTGFCVVCGKKAPGFVEPDAERYPCPRRHPYRGDPTLAPGVGYTVNDPTVYGAEHLLFMTVA